MTTPLACRFQFLARISPQFFQKLAINSPSIPLHSWIFQVNSSSLCLEGAKFRPFRNVPRLRLWHPSFHYLLPKGSKMLQTSKPQKLKPLLIQRTNFKVKSNQPPKLAKSFGSKAHSIQLTTFLYNFCTFHHQPIKIRGDHQSHSNLNSEVCPKETF